MKSRKKIERNCSFCEQANFLLRNTKKKYQEVPVCPTIHHACMPARLRYLRCYYMIFNCIFLNCGGECYTNEANQKIPLCKNVWTLPLRKRKKTPRSPLHSICQMKRCTILKMCAWSPQGEKERQAMQFKYFV